MNLNFCRFPQVNFNSQYWIEEGIHEMGNRTYEKVYVFEIFIVHITKELNWTYDQCVWMFSFPYLHASISSPDFSQMHQILQRIITITQIQVGLCVMPCQISQLNCANISFQRMTFCCLNHIFESSFYRHIMFLFLPRDRFKNIQSSVIKIPNTCHPHFDRCQSHH